MKRTYQVVLKSGVQFRVCGYSVADVHVKYLASADVASVVSVMADAAKDYL